MKLIKIALIFIALTTIASCKTKEKDPSAELSYVEAMTSLEDKNFVEAAEKFAAIDDEFPFSKWATKGQIMAIYSYYRAKEYDDLLKIADDFVKLNPTNENIDYILYIRGMVYYNQIPAPLRAQDLTKQASLTFRELIARFPSSQYSVDAKTRLEFIDEHLAGAVMSTGRYGVRMQNYVGSINEFQEVITRYHSSNQVPEAYFRLAEIYYKLGIPSEFNKAYKTLNDNYPQNYFAKLSKTTFKK